MKRLLVFLLLCALSVFGQSSAPSTSKPAAPKAAPKSAQPAAVEPDDGTLNGQVYASEYFGFRYTVPEGFAVVEDPSEGEEDASKRSFVLLSAFGDKRQRGSAVTILADQSAPTGAADAYAYLTKVTLPVMKGKGFNPENAVRRVTLAGHSFAVVDFLRGDGAQSVYVTLLRGYALSFVLMAPTRADLEQLAASLSALQFPPAPKPRTAPAAPVAH